MEITIKIDGQRVEVQPEGAALPKFRRDMNVKKAVRELEEAYIKEAFRQYGGEDKHGSLTGVAKLLGFNSYQAFKYWLARRRKK